MPSKTTAAQAPYATGPHHNQTVHDALLAFEVVASDLDSALTTLRKLARRQPTGAVQA